MRVISSPRHARTRRSAPRHAHSRSGITLLEVLISTFVIGMAILGLASLLPVGGYQLNLANELDRGTALGRQAMQKILAEDLLLNPGAWTHYTAQGKWYNAVKNSTYDPFLPAHIDQAADSLVDDLRTWDDYVQSDLGDYQNVDDWGEPFLIDPLLISSAGADIAEHISEGVDWPGKWFPYYLGTPESLPNMPRIPRVTVSTIGTLPDGDGGFIPLSYAQAERIFRSHDDLSFDLPTDRTKRPVPILTGGVPDVPSPPMDPVIQQYVGDYSWMAMVTRAPSDVAPQWYVNQNKADVAPPNRNTYKVSVIVFHKRTLEPVQHVPEYGLAGLPRERPIGIDFVGGGYGGGAVKIGGLPGSATLDFASEYMAVRPNQWVLVCGWTEQWKYITDNFASLTNMNGVGSAIAGDNRRTLRPLFRWYRVAAADDGPRKDPVSGNWHRTLTLAGPDVNPAEFVSGEPIYCVIVDGVIGVYEKTIQRQP